MTAFADPSDLIAYLGGSITLDRAAVLLDHASNIIRGVARQQIDYVEDDLIILDPMRDVVLLPELPVIDVSHVDVLLTVGIDTGWTEYTDRFVWSRTGTIRAVLSPRWPRTPGSVRVTYSHGYETIPADLASVAVSLAARLATNPVHLQSQQVGGVQTRYAPTSGASVLDDVEQAIVDRYSVVGVS